MHTGDFFFLYIIFGLSQQYACVVKVDFSCHVMTFSCHVLFYNYQTIKMSACWPLTSC